MQSARNANGWRVWRWWCWRWSPRTGRAHGALEAPRFRPPFLTP